MTKFHMNTFGKIIAFSVLLITLMSCGSSHTIQRGDSAEVAFEKAMSLYDAERYSRAAEAFEVVLSISRGTALAADAQFYLAQSHFNNNSFLLAASEFQRFSRTYTNDERRIEAEFMEAYSYYMMSPRYNLDQTDTYTALDRFQLFVTRHPDSDLADEAHEYMDELRDKLARKKFEAAEMYFRIGEYRSAALYYELTVEDFPESRWTERALLRKIETYVRYAENSVRERQQERFEEAVDSYQQYVQIFPRGEHRDRAEEFYNEALDGLAELATVTAER